ncbi:(2Fe-2S) ferredoxin domain-containing protein [bacterium]|nr:(2Fe-2S) ferredoxin domain-containing protein [bacterium]
MAKYNIKVCMGSSCFARGNFENLNFLEEYIKENNLDADIELTGGLCQEKCASGPNIYINDELYSEVNQDRLKEVLDGLMIK